MRKVNVEITLYNFEELDFFSKERALADHRQFMIETLSESDFDFPGDYDSSIAEIEINNEYVIENIQANEYWYFMDGDIAPTVKYTGKHAKKGITEFMFYGNTYQI